MDQPKKKHRRKKFTFIIEENLKKQEPDTPVVGNYEHYLKYRLQFLLLLKDGKPYRQKGYIGPELVRMAKEGVIIRVGYMFQITEQGRRAIANVKD